MIEHGILDLQPITRLSQIILPRSLSILLTSRIYSTQIHKAWFAKPAQLGMALKLDDESLHIALNAELFADVEALKWVFYHELAHIIQFEREGGTEHDAQWKRIFQLCGYFPSPVFWRKVNRGLDNSLLLEQAVSC